MSCDSLVGDSGSPPPIPGSGCFRPFRHGVTDHLVICPSSKLELLPSGRRTLDDFFQYHRATDINNMGEAVYLN